MRFKLHHELVISLIETSDEQQRAARAENHINFVSSCRIVITILSIFMLFMATWKAFLWSIHLTWSTGSNLKCIFMHTFFASLLSRYTTMRVCREIYSCAEYFFSRTRDEANIGVEKRRFAAKFMLCECFYAKAFYCYLQRMKLEKSKKKRTWEKVLSRSSE